MIYYELAILGGLFILAIVAIAAFGRPLGEAYAEKMKIESREVGSDKSQKLEARIKELEGQVESLSAQVLSLQESLEFTIKLVDKGESIDLVSKESKKTS